MGDWEAWLHDEVEPVSTLCKFIQGFRSLSIGNSLTQASFDRGCTGPAFIKWLKSCEVTVTL